MTIALKDNRHSSFSKIMTLLLIIILMLSFTGCSNESQYSLSKIKLTESERSWSCPDSKYAELLKTYGSETCNGVMVVATDNDIVFLYCEDSFEKGSSTLLSQNTVFDIASVSKTFTAVCILQLAEKGKLDINDTIDKYFPDYEAGKKITISNLLHMSSGIPDYMNNLDPFWGVEGADTVNRLFSDILNDITTDEDFLKALYQSPLLFEAGSSFNYSNTNYRLLAFIIEKVSGMKYCDYVEKNIFKKCGMTKTTSMAIGDMTYLPVNYSEQAEYGFTDKDGYPVCPNNTRGDGGIHSCLTDMVAFNRALFNGELLDEASMKLLLTDELGYCCGLSKDKNGYFHDGSSLTCSAKNRINESQEFGHIYIITFEHSALENSSDNVLETNPMAGTNFTEGTITDNVYENAYADIKFQIPEGFELLSNNLLAADSSDTDDRDGLREASTKIDCLMYDGNGSGSVIEFCFLNTQLGVPDDSDYTADEYLDDYINYMILTGKEDESG